MKWVAPFHSIDSLLFGQCMRFQINSKFKILYPIWEDQLMRTKLFKWFWAIDYHIYKIACHFLNCHAIILDAQKMSEHFWKYQNLFGTDSWMTENNSQWHSKVAPHCSDAHLLNLKLIEILKLCGELMEKNSQKIVISVLFGVIQTQWSSSKTTLRYK